MHTGASGELICLGPPPLVSSHPSVDTYRNCLPLSGLKEGAMAVLRNAC